MSELSIIPGRLIVKDCVLEMSYSKKDGFSIDSCGGNLQVLRQLASSVNFALSTRLKTGEISFECSNSGLTTKDLLENFDLISGDMKYNSVLAEVLDVQVKKVALALQFTSDSVTIISSELSIYKENLNIGPLKLHGIELSIITQLTQGNYVPSFSITANISDDLHTQLEYNAERRILDGQMRVSVSKSIPLLDVFQLLHQSADLEVYKRMQSILKDDCEEILCSDLNITTQPGLTSSMSMSIQLPTEQNKRNALNSLTMEAQDVLKISFNNSSFIMYKFQFNYFNTSTSRMFHLLVVVQKLQSKESMCLDFNFNSNKENSSAVTATVKAGPQGGFLKLRSLIDLADADTPELPDCVQLPPIFDIELLSGSITVNLKPTFKLTAFAIYIVMQEWQILKDPELTVHEIMLKTTWESGNWPQLTFTDCSMTFLGHKIELSGKLACNEVVIECCSAKRLSYPPNLQQILRDYTPVSQTCPRIPTDLGLPPMEVELKELSILLSRLTKRFRVHTKVIGHSPWIISLGSVIIHVNELGGALEWEMNEGSHSESVYRAFLYGIITLYGQRVDMEVILGTNIDCIVAATITNLHYDQVVQDDLLCSEQLVEPDQYDTWSSTSSLSRLVPSTICNISFCSAAVAINVTQKQLFLSSEVEGLGSGSVFIGYGVDKIYIVSLSLEDLGLERLSESLEFIDNIVHIQSVDILISSTDLDGPMASQFTHPDFWVRVHKQLEEPFCASKLHGSSELLERYGFRAGGTVYAEINLARSAGSITKILHLGDETLQHNLSVMMYIGKASVITDLEIHAWIAVVRLFGMLEFSDIDLIYRVKPSHKELELKGTVALLLDLQGSTSLGCSDHESEDISDSETLNICDCDRYSLQFYGALTVRESYAELSAKYISGKTLYQPFGINIEVNGLKAAIKIYFSGEVPDVCLEGRVKIAELDLTCKFLLRGIAFKVFSIYLENDLALHDLFHCAAVNYWPDILAITLTEGQFYYCTSDVTFGDCETGLFNYKRGFHLEAVIILFKYKFRVAAHIVPEFTSIVLSGRSIDQVNFGFAKITGERPYSNEGPALKCEVSTDLETSLMLTLGVEILKTPYFEGELKYNFTHEYLEGTITYLGRILWVEEPSMTVQWHVRKNEFRIVNFNLFGDDIPFNPINAIAKFSRIIYSICTGRYVSFSIRPHLKTGENPDPKKYLVKFILYGEIEISILGILHLRIFPLPEVPILLPKFRNFSFGKLPQYIKKCLFESMGPICQSLKEYINPWKFLKKSADMMMEDITGAFKAVENLAKKAVGGVKKIYKGLRSFFGHSAFIIDPESGMVLGYICGGKAGKELCNEKFTVNHFGQILTVHAISAMAHDVHMNFSSCITAHELKDLKLEENLEKLMKTAEKLSEKVTLAADNILAVTELSINVVDERCQLSIEFGAYNPEEKIFYSEDKGDIEYHIKIIATLISNEKVEKFDIYDNIFTKKLGLLTEDNSTTVHHQVVETQGYIVFQTPFDPDILAKMIHITVSVQPKVTLQVKMLPPDKITNDDYLVREQVDSEDVAWMEKAKKEIEKNGKMNEVTLNGLSVCRRHLTRPHTESNVQFTFHCAHQKDNLTATGIITPVPEGEFYLIQLVDETDMTNIIKQFIVHQSKLNYEITVSNHDFPETSLGPYCMTVLALRTDYSNCSAFTNSEVVSRYCPPKHTNKTLPDLDESEKDIVRLHWSHHKSIVKKVSEAEDEPDCMSTQQVQAEDYFYTVTIRGIHIEVEKEKKAITSDNVSSCDEAFNPVQVDLEQSTKYEFSLKEFLKEYAKNFEMKDGLLFQCQVITNGFSALHSIPKLFSEFVLLAPPSNLTVTTLKCTGLSIGWEYCAHAISYRLELLADDSGDIAFHKVLECKEGSHGEDIINHIQVKNIGTEAEKSESYHLQMYSLGFGQDLIRCLEPAKASTTVQVMKAKLHYLLDLDVVRVEFWPVYDREIDFMVELVYKINGNEPNHLVTKTVCYHMAMEKMSVDFSNIQWQQMIGNSITAWICTEPKPGADVIAAGVPREEISVVDFLNLTTSYCYRPNSTIVCGMKVTWSNAEYDADYRCCKYVYGYYIAERKEYFTVEQTLERRASFNFSVQKLPCNGTVGLHQFQLYVSSFGQGIQEEIIIRGLSLDTNLLYCLVSPQHKQVIFTSILLHELWTEHVIQYNLSHCFNFSLLPTMRYQRHFMFPCGDRFPSIQISPKHEERFWKTEFGNGK